MQTVAMTAAKATEKHKKLERLAGTFVGRETVFPCPFDEQGGAATSKVESRMTPDGLYLMKQYVRERDGEVLYRGHGTYCWDEAKNCYVVYWFDNFGALNPLPPAEGTWKGNVLSFLHRGRSGQTRLTYNFEAGSDYRFKIEISADGKHWSAMMEGRYSRK